MQKQDLGHHLKTLPKPLLVPILIDLYWQKKLESSVRRDLLDDARRVAIQTQDAKLMRWYFRQAKGMYINQPFEMYAEFLRELLHQEYLAAKDYVDVAYELARQTLIKAKDIEVLSQDSPLYGRAKEIFDDKNQVNCADDKKFVIEAAYYMSLLHYTGSMFKVVQTLPKDFMIHFLRYFDQLVDRNRHQEFGDAIAICFGHLLLIWYIKQVFDSGNPVVRPVLAVMPKLKKHLRVMYMEPALMVLQLHDALFENKNLSRAKAVLCEVRDNAVGGANFTSMANLSRFALQKFILQQLESGNKKGIHQSWELIKEAPILCRELELELWFREIKNCCLDCNIKTAVALLGELIELMRRYKNTHTALLMQTAKNSSALYSGIDLFLEHYTASRQECHCMYRFSAEGLHQNSTLFDPPKPRDAGDDETDQVIKELAAVFRSAGMHDVELHKVPAQALLGLRGDQNNIENKRK